jgi:serine/threonine protein kinase
VKLLSPEMTNESTAAGFEHEVQMTSQLTHPNTVAIYDYGRTPEGLFYYAMEYLSGINLHRLVREFGPQSEGRVIHILRQVCGSIAEAHRSGLIHRDIKPANIVLTRRGGQCDVVKVLDFGLVKAVYLGPKGLPRNAVVGTPHFMSPEAVSKPETVDAKSDIYSVGAVGYWLLTGTTMFENENVDSLLKSQTTDTPPDASERRGAQVSADLERLLMRCLAKEPEQRPQTAGALDELLARCISAGTWTSEEAESWWHTNMVGIEAIPTTTIVEKTLVIAPRT